MKLKQIKIVLSLALLFQVLSYFGCHPKPVKVNVQLLDGGSTLIDIDNEKTIKDLKQKIFEAMNMPIGQQKIVYSGQARSDEKTLSAISSSNEFSVHLIINLRYKEPEENEFTRQLKTLQQGLHNLQKRLIDLKDNLSTLKDKFLDAAKE